MATLSSRFTPASRHGFRGHRHDISMPATCHRLTMLKPPQQRAGLQDPGAKLKVEQDGPGSLWHMPGHACTGCAWCAPSAHLPRMSACRPWMTQSPGHNAAPLLSLCLALCITLSHGDALPPESRPSITCPSCTQMCVRGAHMGIQARVFCQCLGNAEQGVCEGLHAQLGAPLRLLDRVLPQVRGCSDLPDRMSSARASPQ